MQTRGMEMDEVQWRPANAKPDVKDDVIAMAATKSRDT
jgi:hypothetical protein